MYVCCTHIELRKSRKRLISNACKLKPKSFYFISSPFFLILLQPHIYSIHTTFKNSATLFIECTKYHRCRVRIPIFANHKNVNRMKARKEERKRVRERERQKEVKAHTFFTYFIDFFSVEWQAVCSKSRRPIHFFLLLLFRVDINFIIISVCKRVYKY